MSIELEETESSASDLIGVISDIHSNFPALKSILQALDGQGVTRIYCCGDVVGYGPFPNECCQALRERKIKSIAGNHDHAVLGLTSYEMFNEMARKAVIWTHKYLSAENLAYLYSLPLTISEEDFFIVHASPEDPPEWNYILTLGDARQNFKYFKQKVCFIGHSHQPFVVKIRGEELECPDSRIIPLASEERAIINVGSVGQPRDQNALACCVIYDTAQKEARFLRCPYDITATQAALLENDLPFELGMRLNHGW